MTPDAAILLRMADEREAEARALRRAAAVAVVEPRGVEPLTSRVR